jgi:hypothetical protein
MGRQIGITLTLDDDTAPRFDGCDRILCMPSTAAEWQAIMEHTGRLMNGVETIDRVVAKMRNPDDPGALTEGLARPADLMRYVVESEGSVRTLLSRSVVARDGAIERKGRVQ